MLTHSRWVYGVKQIMKRTAFGILAALVVTSTVPAATLAAPSNETIEQRIAKAKIAISKLDERTGDGEQMPAAQPSSENAQVAQHWRNHHHPWHDWHNWNNWRNHHHH